MRARILPVALCFAGLAVGFTHATLTVERPTGDACVTWDVHGDSDSAWDFAQSLQERGWYGDPSDGAERLYSPSCRPS